MCVEVQGLISELSKYILLLGFQELWLGFFDFGVVKIYRAPGILRTLVEICRKMTFRIKV